MIRSVVERNAARRLSLVVPLPGIVFLVTVLFKLPTWHGLHIAAWAFLPTIVVGIMYWRERRTVRRFLKQHDFLVCPECMYPLRAAGDYVTCPECGMSYSPPDVRCVWRKEYNNRSDS